MHVVVLFEYPTLHGGERSLLAIMKELQRQHSPVTFTAVAPQSGPLAAALAEMNVRHVPWSVRDTNGQRRPADEVQASALDVLRDLQPDLVHANSLAMGRWLGRIAGRLDVPTSSHLRDILGLSAAAIADLNRNTLLIAVSEATRSFHVAQGLDAAKTVMIHNGIDLAEFQPRPATGFLHRELQLPMNSRLVATIGQIGLRKGWDVLIDAVIPIASQLPDVHFMFLGARHSVKAESQRYEADLKERIVSAGLQQRVHWLGERSDVARVLNEAALLVHPAHEEPLGRVLLEALASGVPIVATDVGGTREIVAPKVAGRLVPRGDATAFAAAIIDMLSRPDELNTARLASRHHAQSTFSIRSAADATWSAWRSRLASPPAGSIHLKSADSASEDSTFASGS